MTDPPRANPFPGLRSFESGEEHLFFGREHRVDELINKLAQTRFVSVIGSSGTGKSSLVRAGLIPALHSGLMSSHGSRWRVAIAKPGGDPFGNLAVALAQHGLHGAEPSTPSQLVTDLLAATLRRSSKGLLETIQQARLGTQENVLILVDQFEELFRYERGATDRYTSDATIAFVTQLLATAQAPESRVHVVITMRSEFLGNCLEVPGLPQAINLGQYLVPRMSRDELRAAITGPVGVARATITDRLVWRVLNDADRESSQLPVVQHAMMRVWRAWQSAGDEQAPLDVEHYEHLGGLSGALAGHVEAVYSELTEDDQEAAGRIFRALTEKTPGEPAVRNPMALAGLGTAVGLPEEDLQRLLQVFARPGRSFLALSRGTESGAPTVVDISHESLIDKWERLHDWADEEMAAAATYRRLEDSARRWERETGNLLRDPELSVALAWRDDSKPTSEWARRYGGRLDSIMRFLASSEAEREKEVKRRAVRLRLTTTAAVMFATVSVLAIWQTIEAREQREIASNQAARAQAEAENADAFRLQVQVTRDSLADQAELVTIYRAQNDSVAAVVETLLIASQQRADTTPGLFSYTLPGPPIEGEVLVTLPTAPGAEPELETILSVSPFDMSYAVYCTPDGDVNLSFEAPAWISATPRQGTADPELCTQASGWILTGLTLDSVDVVVDGRGGNNAWEFEVGVDRDVQRTDAIQLDNDDGMHRIGFDFFVESGDPQDVYRLRIVAEDRVSGAFVEGELEFEPRPGERADGLILPLSGGGERTLGHFYAYLTAYSGRARGR